MGPRTTRHQSDSTGRLTSDHLAERSLRPWRSWGITAALWALVIGGAVAGVLGMARSGETKAAPTANAPVGPAQVPAEVLGSAEWAVRVSLTEPEGAVAAAVVVDAAERPRSTVSPVEVMAATAVQAEPAGEGYWAVLVATDVRSGANGGGQRWYLEVGVVETDSGPVAMTDPALVPAPVVPVGSVAIDGPAPSRPDRTDPVVATVESFLAALVSGDPTVNRWTAPGVDVWPAAAPGVFVDVDLTAIAVERRGTNEVTARAEIAVVTADELLAVFAYTVQLVERDGRWEVVAVGATPRVRRIVDSTDHEPFAPAATSPASQPAAATGESTSSPTTKP